MVERRNQPNTTPSWKRSSTRGSKTTPDTLVTRKAVTSIQPSAPTTSLTAEGKTVTLIISYVELYAYWLILSYDLLEDWRIDDITANDILLFLSQKKIDFMLLGVCRAVINHRRRQNVVRTSVIHSAALCMPLSCVLTTFDLYVLLLYRRTATWNLFIKLHLCKPYFDLFKPTLLSSPIRASERRLNASNQVIIIIMVY